MPKKTSRRFYLCGVLMLVGLLVGRLGRSALTEPSETTIWHRDHGTAPDNFSVLAFPKDGTWSIPLVPARSVIFSLEEFQDPDCCRVFVTDTKDIFVPREEFTLLSQAQHKDFLIRNHSKALLNWLDPVLHTVTHTVIEETLHATRIEFSERYDNGGYEIYRYEVMADGMVSPISMTSVERDEHRSTASRSMLFSLVGMALILVGFTGIWIPILRRRLRR